MAIMGLRINQSTGPRIDASLGETFAKALFGDPEREMKLALARSDLETDEYNRRQIEANTNWIKAREATEQFNLSGRQGMVDPITEILLREQGLPTAAPAIVSPPAEQPPAPVVAEAPAIVETPEPDRSPSPAPAAAEPPAPIPSILEQPAPVYEEEAPTLEQAPVTGGMADANFLLGQRPGADYYEDLEGMPVVVDPQAEASIVSPPELPPEPAPAPPAPAPQPAPAPAPAVLPEQAPVPTPRPQVEETAGGGVKITTPAGPIVLTREQAEALATGIVANQGDVAGQTAKFGGQLGIIRDPTLTAAQKLAILFTGNVPGKESILGGPDAGKPKDNILVIDNVPYTVGVDANGKPTLTPTTGGPVKADKGMISATGIEGDYQRHVLNIQEKMRTNQPITAEEASFYDAAVTALYEGKVEVRTDPTTNDIISVRIDPDNPTILASPSAVYKRANVPLPAPAQPAPAPATAAASPSTEPNPVPGTPDATVAATATADAASPAPSPAPTSAAVPSQGGGGPSQYAVPDGAEAEIADANYGPTGTGSIQILRKGKQKMTEIQSRNTAFYIVSKKANALMDTVQPPPPWQMAIADPSNTGFWARMAQGYLTTPETQEYLVNAMNFANAVLRSESGAATRPEELGLVFTRFIPQAQDSAATRALKTQYRAAVLEGLRLGALGDKPTAAELEAYAMSHVATPAPAPAGGGGPSTGDIDMNDPEAIRRELARRRAAQPGGQQ